MKVALVSYSTPGFELPHAQTKQTSFYHSTFWADFVLPEHVATLPERHLAKYPKMLAHELLPNVEAYVWLDGSMQITSPSFVDWLVEQLGDHDAGFFSHPDRSCAYEEARYCINEIAEGNGYLAERYNPDALLLQLRHYNAAGFPKNLGLHCGGIFIRRNNARTNLLFERWWKEQMHSLQDQISLPYVMWQTPDVSVVSLSGSIWGNDHFRWCGHVRGDGNIEKFA